MNKNILFIILWLLIINLYSIASFYENYSWKNLYETKDYSWSILKFEKSWNINWVYNKANSLYKQQNYEEGIKEYKSILTDKKNELNFRLNHNIWNSFYRIWESNEDIEIKIKNWQESVNFYTDALNIKYDEQTKQNLEFVLKKIKENKSEEEDKDNKQNKDDSQNSDNQENTWSWTSQEDNSSESWSWNTNKSSWETDNENKWENNLSDEQIQALKQYEEALKEEQKNNTDSFNKVYEESNTNDIFDNFFNDPFFNNDLLNNTNEEKDW